MSGITELTLGPGRPPDSEVELAALSVVKNLGAATPERVRREVSNALGRTVSWNTIAKYLDRAAERGELTKRVLSVRKRKLVAFLATDKL